VPFFFNKLAASVEALVCLRDGNIIGKAALHIFCSDAHELHEEEVSLDVTTSIIDC